MLVGVGFEDGKTLNAVLSEAVFGNFPGGGVIVVLTLLSEGLLLMVGAQAGFIDGPRVLANMALDRWFPTRFASLSDRFVAHNGILLMGGAAFVLILVSRGAVSWLWAQKVPLWASSRPATAPTLWAKGWVGFSSSPRLGPHKAC